MSKSKSYRFESRGAWGYEGDRAPSREELKLGAILRVADALEAIVARLDTLDIRLHAMESLASKALERKYKSKLKDKAKAKASAKETAGGGA